MAAVTVLSGDSGAVSGFLQQIETDTMAPTFESGDWIWCADVEDPAELKVDDIITYWTVTDRQRTRNTHRIVEIHDYDSYLIFGTQGDNNMNADLLTVHESEIVGVYRFKLPF